MVEGRRGNPLYRLDKDLVEVEAALSEMFGVPRHLIRNYAYAWGLLIVIAALESFDPKYVERLYGHIKEMVIGRLEELKKRHPRRA
ncbi:MAG: hypothetical protein BA066_07720 [Candidatus Korarchaeota archaeon NZ13-K]|nr:MAG: hypothetical protein BA066_07720 [Candidatus Korarchaeota archaeon NZ13-K]